MVKRRWFGRGAALLSGGLVAGLLLPVVTAHAAATRYEAENATISQGTVASNHTGFSGTGFVDYTNVTGSYVEFTVNASSAGTATLSLGYANGTTVNRPMTITVNGTTIATATAFNSTTNWDTWATKTLTAPVVAGTIRPNDSNEIACCRPCSVTGFSTNASFAHSVGRSPNSTSLRPVRYSTFRSGS